MALGTISPRNTSRSRSTRNSAGRPRREAVLRAVVATADARRDGVLPTDVDGVAQTFADDLELVAALQLRWHTRLAGHIEAALAAQPMDLEQAVLCAWRRAARELVGIRLVLDRVHESPDDAATAEALSKARHKDWSLLAVMSGQAGVHDPQAAEVGRVLELLARASFDPMAVPPTSVSRPNRRRPGGVRRMAPARHGAIRSRMTRLKERVAA
ncbi:MAG: hypothetical protein ACTHKG_12150 [Nocardioides sp.]